MQGEKKGGAGSKGVWGKMGDEFKKNITYDPDDYEIEMEAQAKFTQEVAQKLIEDKLFESELEPHFSEAKPIYPPMKFLYYLHKPSLAQFVLHDKEKINKESRNIIELVYNDSIFITCVI